MSINVWGYLKEYHYNKSEILNAVESVFESGHLILGESVRNFENRYAQYVGVKYGVGCDNGTNAIFLALKALGIGSGDEVITVTNTAIPTVSAIVSTGATPVFVDINPLTYLMNVEKLEEHITDRTKAIVPVHLYGQCVDMDILLDIADRHKLFVIEDCAQAHGAMYRGKKAGSMSAVSATSFYPTKILGAFGDGGMILTDNMEIDKKLRSLRFYGAEKTYYANEHGYNSRLDELQAAILLVKLRHIEEYISRRREIASMYNECLSDTDVRIPCEAEYCTHAYYLYVVRHKRRDRIIEHLRRNDIFVNISYPWPIHLMKGYRYLGYEEGDFPHAESATKEIFSLPMYPSLTDDEIYRVCDVIHQYFKQ